MADVAVIPPSASVPAPRRRRRLSNLVAGASMMSWVVLGAMPVVAVILALT